VSGPRGSTYANFFLLRSGAGLARCWVRVRGSCDCEKGYIMQSLKNLMTKLVKDEQGGEVLEYALIAGLIVVAAIAVIGAVGTKVLARWNSLNNGR
jgi:Flp pilus assembly pilin Flp